MHERSEVKRLCDLNVGLLFPFRNPPQWRRPFAQFYAEQLEQTRVAEELGFNEIWLTEHHFAEDGYSPAILPIASAIAAITKRIRIGTYLVLLPLHNAVRVAEDAATVDIISNGRFDLGVGQGYAPGEFAAYGIDRKTRAARLEEGIEVIRGAWTKDDFSFEGRHYNVKNIRLMPRPVQSPHPPLWIGAGAPKAIERAGRMGCHFMGLANPVAQQTYDASLKKAGRNPKDFKAAQLHFTYIARTTDEAWAHCQEHLHYMIMWYSRWLAESGDYLGANMPALPEPAKLRDAQVMFPLLIGNPNEVAAKLNQSFKQVRTTDLVLAMNLPGLAPERSRSSMELFAREVAPQLKPVS
ncbi:MAG TPA: LLM class flavin-dependent oxidoreductase [Candidatus Binataceae bacterium]|nr:LLM class flavin-dependent oxidoreductase [Candidatus Binataceae bacterium]